MLGASALGVALREHRLLAGGIIAAAWLAGTARGLFLVHQADQGRLACALPGARRRRLRRVS